MRTPPDEKDQMWSQSSVCLSELVRREKWNDTLLNENKAGVESPLPASTSEWSNLLTAESNTKHFHVQFVSVKNRQCPIFATSSLPYFILDKTLFWKKKIQKKCLQIYIVQCCICITPLTVIGSGLWYNLTQSVQTKRYFFFLRKQRFDQAEEGWELHMASEWSVALTVAAPSCQRPCQESQVQAGGGELPRTRPSSRKLKSEWVFVFLGNW